MAEPAIEGLDELIQTIRRLPKELVPKGGPLRKALAKGARMWRAQAKRNAQAIGGPGIKNTRTGQARLADNIISRVDRDPKRDGYTHRYFVGYRSKVFWGSFLERGTEKQPAQPFLAPVPDQVGRAVVKAISDEMARQVDLAVLKAKAR